MAGRGPAPKPSSLRQRRNKTSTAASLPSAADAAEYEVPDLPDREPDHDEEVAVPWHPKVVEWWEAVWRSPMASEFLSSDMKGGLILVAGLYQDFHTATSRTARKEAATEIRLQEARYGLDPISRRRLQWEVARGEEAEKKRRTGRAPKRSESSDSEDPRNVLKIS